MRENWLGFIKHKIDNFTEAAVNLFIFLPYFFSVKPLLKTLFKPWKNLTAPKKPGPESLDAWFSRISFNWISSLIGFVLRLSLLTAFLTFQTVYIILLPFFFIIYLALTPAFYFISLFQTPPDQKKARLYQQFLQMRLLDKTNKETVSQWFESYYHNFVKKDVWWKLSKLLSTPPLARDWAYGFTPTLDEYADDLTLAKPHYKNLINRLSEITQIEQILAKSEEHNVIIVGEEGVGKHTIVEGLAKKIYEGKSLPVLNFKRILKVDIGKIVSLGSDSSQKEQLVKSIFNEASQAGNIILLIDDFDRFVDASLDRIDLSTTIAPFARSETLQIIGITTPFAYQKYVARNDKISVLFEKVDVAEIKKSAALEILLNEVFDFEKRFKITIPYEAIKEAVDKSDAYITDIPFPEKAIDLLDEACVYAYEKEKKAIVTPEAVDIVLQIKTRTPVMLDQAFKDKLLNLEAKLQEKIVEQKEGIRALSSALRQSFVAVNTRKKPLASLLFLGPTGVGKTETAKALAEVFFSGQKDIIRFDMSLYQTKFDIPNLIGSQHTGNPGLLSAAIREKPYGILLIDEIEKADQDLLNIFLTILDEGYFTDGFGNRVDCRNLIIIATSNAGSGFINKMLSETNDVKTDSFINYLIEKERFLPEFLNRFDGVIVYRPLDNKAIYIIATRIISAISDNIFKTFGVKLTVTPGLIGTLIEKSYDPKFGARNMERVIRDEVEDKVAKMVLANKLKKGETITL